MAATITLREGAPKPKTPIWTLVQIWVGRLVLVGVAVWMVYKLVQVGPAQFFQSAVDGLSNGTLYALIALGYTLVYGIIELINFAHGDLFMLGTIFSAWVLSDVLNQSTVSVAGWLSLVVALVAVMAICGSINGTIELLAYRRLRRAPKLAPLITAVGMSFILQQVGLILNGSTPKQWPSVLPQGGFSIGGVQIAWTFITVLCVTIPLLLLMSFIVQRTRRGKAMRATAQDQDAARLMGINVNRTISFTFILGGALAGAAGVMYQQTVGTTAYNLGQQLGLIAFTAAVLGGIGNLTGAVLGGVIIGVIQGVNEGLPLLGQRWSQSVVFTVLILLIIFKPEGILGKPTTEKV
jgi:branched-chain amino acid transport system permease protein